MKKLLCLGLGLSLVCGVIGISLASNVDTVLMNVFVPTVVELDITATQLDFNFPAPVPGSDFADIVLTSDYAITTNAPFAMKIVGSLQEGLPAATAIIKVDLAAPTAGTGQAAYSLGNIPLSAVAEADVDLVTNITACAQMGIAATFTCHTNLDAGPQDLNLNADFTLVAVS